MIILTDEYAGRIDAATAGHPGGQFKNETIPGTSNDGTPLDKVFLNNWEGIFQAILDDAGITPDGAIEQVGASQVLDAIKIVSRMPAGTRMLFQQTTAPTGWTKDTTINEHALRVVSGSVSTGGTVDFSTVFARTATDGHTLLASQSGLPSHNHIQGVPASSNLGSEGNLTQYGWTSVGSNRKSSQYGDPSDTNELPYTSTTGGTAASSAHSHNIDLRVKYADVIIATKD